MENCEPQTVSVCELLSSKLMPEMFGTVPDLQIIGNRDLLKLPLFGIFCSRKCPGDAILKAYDLARELREKETPVIGGFHTPIEKDMLEILLMGKGPLVVCPARGLEGMRIPISYKMGIQQKRLLLLSIFPGHVNRIIKETAYKRNQFVASCAKDIIFIHIEPGGETEKLAKQFGDKMVV